LIVLIILVIFVLSTGAPFSTAYFALPIVIVIQGLFIAGVTLPVSAITPFFPDIRMVVDNFVRLWFFMSGIFYDIGEFSESTQQLFRLNPMVVIIEWYRDILLHGTVPGLFSVLSVLVVSSVLTGIGWWLIRRYDFDYPKIAF
jgi:lipopolysaccharide transport system permease protein